MKKLLGLLCALLCAPWAQANTMNFVTVLSSPVGSFNKLEAVDFTRAAKAPVINFCTGVGDNGLVTLQGSSHPEMTTLNLSQNTTLGGNGQNYVLSSITMKNGGRLKGSRLLANTVKVANDAAGKSDNLYTDTLTVAGAKAKKLTVGDKAAYIEGKDGQYSPQMAWSNQYQDDKACKDGNKCAGQYLLKQKGSATAGDDDKNKRMCIVKIEWRTKESSDSIISERCDLVNTPRDWWSTSSSEKTCALGEECNCTEGEWVVVKDYFFACKLGMNVQHKDCNGKTIKTGAFWGKCRREDPHVCLPASQIPFKPSNINNIGITSNCSNPLGGSADGELADGPVDWTIEGPTKEF